MAKITHGTCNHCKRENVNLPSPGKCSRCYDRMKRGVDIFTGEPLETKEPVSLKIPAPSTHVTPAILADDEPPSEHRVNDTEAAPPGSKASNPPLRAHDYSAKKQKDRAVQEPAPKDLPTCSIDLAAVIDKAWQYRRSVMLQRLSDCPEEDDRFMMTCDFICEIRGIADPL